MYFTPALSAADTYSSGSYTHSQISLRTPSPSLYQ